MAERRETGPSRATGPRLDEAQAERREIKIPPLNLSWWHATKQWGTWAKVGKKGLTLSAINVGLYGDVPDVWTNQGRTARGVVDSDAAVPSLGFTVLEKQECWADNAADLYEEGIQRRWSSATDIPWDTLRPHPEEVERAICQICTELSERSLLMSDVIAGWNQYISYGFHEVKVFLAVVTYDLFRHFEAFRKRALANGGGLGLQTPQWNNRVLVDAKNMTEWVMDMMLLQNSYMSTLCQYAMGLVCCEADYKLFQLVAQDLARHRAYAMEHLRYVLLRANRRRGELLAYLTKGEQFLVRDENLNKALPAAFAILAGGNLENMAEGMALYERMRSEATERYVRMLEWAGLREKREQLNPTMASWLPKPVGATYEVEVEAIKPGGLHLGKAEGVPVLIAEVEGQYYALNNRCTHQGCPLSGGSLEGHILQCRCHGSRFDVRTGQVVGGPAERPVETYAVRVENGKVIVTL